MRAFAKATPWWDRPPIRRPRTGLQGRGSPAVAPVVEQFLPDGQLCACLGDAIGERLDAKIEATVAEVCELLRTDAQEDITAEDDPGREHESEAEAPAPAAATPTHLQQAARVAQAQAWKGQQIAKGWRKPVNALPRRKEAEG